MLKSLIKHTHSLLHWWADRRAFHATRRLQAARATGYAVNLITTGALRRHP